MKNIIVIILIMLLAGCVKQPATQQVIYECEDCITQAELDIILEDTITLGELEIILEDYASIYQVDTNEKNIELQYDKLNELSIRVRGLPTNRDYYSLKYSIDMLRD